MLLGDGRQLGKITQGVTTGILGEGSTPAPLNPANLPPDASELQRRLSQPHGFDAWLSAMEAHGISQNVGSFVGAGTIRQYGMAERMGAATRRARSTRCAPPCVAAMEDGAFGMASALIYPPNTFATTEELIEESKAMAPYGGVYITHMRSEADHLLEAVDEVIRISREGGVPGEIYHLKAAGTRNWSKEAPMIAKIDSARAAGIDVQADMYPYTAGATGLTSCLPPSYLRRRQAVRQPRQRGHSREDPPGGRASDERVGEPVRARDARGRADHESAEAGEPAVHRQAARRDRADEERGLSRRRDGSHSRASTVASRRRIS